jgi:hypothetical protein
MAVIVLQRVRALLVGKRIDARAFTNLDDGQANPCGWVRST